MPQQRLGIAYPAVVIHSGGGRGAQVPKLELRLGNAGGIPSGVEAVAEHVLCQRLTRLVHKQVRGVRFGLGFVRLDLGQQLLKFACYLDAQLGCLALADVEHAAGNVVGAHAKHVGRALAIEERQVDSEPQGSAAFSSSRAIRSSPTTTSRPSSRKPRTPAQGLEAFVRPCSRAKFHMREQGLLPIGAHLADGIRNRLSR